MRRRLSNPTLHERAAARGGRVRPFAGVALRWATDSVTPFVAAHFLWGQWYFVPREPDMSVVIALAAASRGAVLYRLAATNGTGRTVHRSVYACAYRHRNGLGSP